MRKFLRRALGLALACVTALCAAAPALAAGVIDPERDAQLTIVYEQGETKLSGAQFDLYRVAAVDAYARMTRTARFSGYPIALDGQDQSGWAALATTLKGYVWQDALEPDATGQTDETGTLRFALSAGLYLVIGSRRTIGDVTYAATPFLVFLPGENLEENTWDYAVTAYPKVEGEQNPADDPDDRLVTRKVLESGTTRRRRADGRKTSPSTCCATGRHTTPSPSAPRMTGATPGTTWNAGHEWLVTEDAVTGYTQAVSQEGDHVYRDEHGKAVDPDNANDPDNTDDPDDARQAGPPVAAADGAAVVAGAGAGGGGPGLHCHRPGAPEGQRTCVVRARRGCSPGRCSCCWPWG